MDDQKTPLIGEVEIRNERLESDLREEEIQIEHSSDSSGEEQILKYVENDSYKSKPMILKEISSDIEKKVGQVKILTERLFDVNIKIDKEIHIKKDHIFSARGIVTKMTRECVVEFDRLMKSGSIFEPLQTELIYRIVRARYLLEKFLKRSFDKEDEHCQRHNYTGFVNHLRLSMSDTSDTSKENFPDTPLITSKGVDPFAVDFIGGNKESFNNTLLEIDSILRRYVFVDFFEYMKAYEKIRKDRKKENERFTFLVSVIIFLLVMICFLCFLGIVFLIFAIVLIVRIVMVSDRG